MIFFLPFLVAVFASSAFAKCLPPNYDKVVWTRKIDEKTLPPSVEVVDRVWIRNTGSTELITFTFEKGVLARTGYRTILGNVPTTADELPVSKLVNGERYEFHYPGNPDYSSGTLIQGGWVRQDYTAALIEPRRPVLKPEVEERVFSGKLDGVVVKVPVPIYSGRKRSKIDFIYEFTKNAKYGVIDPACPPPSPSPTPSVSP